MPQLPHELPVSVLLYIATTTYRTARAAKSFSLSTTTTTAAASLRNTVRSNSNYQLTICLIMILNNHHAQPTPPNHSFRDNNVRNATSTHATFESIAAFINSQVPPPLESKYSNYSVEQT